MVTPLDQLKNKILPLESKEEVVRKEEREIREGHASNLHPKPRSLQDQLGNLPDLIQLQEQRSKLHDLHQPKSVAESSVNLKLLQLQSLLKIKTTAAMMPLITLIANGMIFTMIAPTLMMDMVIITLTISTTIMTTAMKEAGERCTIHTSTSCST